MTFQPLVRAVPAPEKLKSSWSLRFQKVSSAHKIAKDRFVEARLRTSDTGMDGNMLSKSTSIGSSEREGIVGEVSWRSVENCFILRPKGENYTVIQ
jgi:hypothetical protein